LLARWLGTVSTKQLLARWFSALLIFGPEDADRNSFTFTFNEHNFTLNI
jgi:hypothetical protein